MPAARIRLVVVAVGVAGLLLVLGGAWWLAAGRDEPHAARWPATPAPSPSATPSAATAGASAYRAPMPTVVIPDGVMMTVADLDHPAQLAPLDPPPIIPYEAVLPRACEAAGFRSDTQRVGARLVVAAVDVAGDGRRTDSLVHYVAVYGGSGAHQFLTELRLAPECRRDDSWTVLGEAGAGEDSVLLRRKTFQGLAGETELEQFVAVIRVGRAVGVVASMESSTPGGADRATTVARRLMGRLGPIG